MPTYLYRHRGTLGQLVDPETLIGRSEECAIRVEHANVSRVHAALRLGPDGVEVVDLGSMNGTRVNGQRILGPRLLSNGDVVQIGLDLIEIEIASETFDARLLTRSGASAVLTRKPLEATAVLLDTVELVEAIVAGPDLADRPEDTARTVRALLGSALDAIDAGGECLDPAVAARISRLADALAERVPSELASGWVGRTRDRVRALGLQRSVK